MTCCLNYSSKRCERNVLPGCHFVLLLELRGIAVPISFIFAVSLFSFVLCSIDIRESVCASPSLRLLALSEGGPSHGRCVSGTRWTEALRRIVGFRLLIRGPHPLSGIDESNDGREALLRFLPKTRRRRNSALRASARCVSCRRCIIGQDKGSARCQPQLRQCRTIFRGRKSPEKGCYSTVSSSWC